MMAWSSIAGPTADLHQRQVNDLPDYERFQQNLKGNSSEWSCHKYSFAQDSITRKLFSPTKFSLQRP